MTLAVADRWYEVESVGDGISIIRETHVMPWLRCNMWHVRGRDRDLLIDSGMGLRPLKTEVAALGRGRLTAIQSHCHFDHMGGLHEFDERLGHRAEAAVFADPTLDDTCATEWIKAEVLSALPHAGYDLDTYTIKPAPLTGYLDEGDVVDLGDRAFNVFHLPGHSPGSIALYDRKSEVLFSGDVIYDGELLDNLYHSEVETYRRSLSRLRELPVSVVHAGHEPSFGAERLRGLIESYFAGGQRMPSVKEFLRPYLRRTG